MNMTRTARQRFPFANDLLLLLFTNPFDLRLAVPDVAAQLNETRADLLERAETGPYIQILQRLRCHRYRAGPC